MSVNLLNQATGAVPVPDWRKPAMDLARLWPALISGHARIVDSGASEGHHYLQFVTERAAPRGNKFTPGRVKIFERVVMGDAPKVIAMELGCSVSTVATAVGECLRAMGLGSGRVPALLVLMLHALRGRSACADIHVERAPGHVDRQVVTVSRLESSLGQRLTVCEMAVVSLLVEGKTHLEIATLRRTSTRTVANQIASAYRKLGVSCRMDLLCYLASRLEANTARSN